MLVMGLDFRVRVVRLGRAVSGVRSEREVKALCSRCRVVRVGGRLGESAGAERELRLLEERERVCRDGNCEAIWSIAGQERRQASRPRAVTRLKILVRAVRSRTSEAS